MGELRPTAGSIRGMDVIQHRFTAGETGPVTVLLTAPTDWNGPEGRRVLARASRALGYLNNVAEVRSLTQPLGTPLPEAPRLSPPAKKGVLAGLLNSMRKGVDEVREQTDRSAREFYLAELPDAPDGRRYVTRIDVVVRSEPFSPASVETLDVIQAWLHNELPREAAALGGVGCECYGVTVNARDLARVTENDRYRVNVLVIGGILLILVVLVRRLWLAVYLLLTVLVSYLAALGATALAGTLWAGRPLDEVDWRVPFFLFTILVAVGEDYNILIIDRALKERRRHGTDEGMRRALARTGGTITSCGLIMAGTFSTLMFGGLGTLVQCGFALAVGVLLDTFVVRPFLVPAFTLLVWRGKEQARVAPAPPRPAYPPPRSSSAPPRPTRKAA
jgi:RND superfamily putative drug exporter